MRRNYKIWSLVLIIGLLLMLCGCDKVLGEDRPASGGASASETASPDVANSEQQETSSETNSTESSAADDASSDTAATILSIRVEGTRVYINNESMVYDSMDALKDGLNAQFLDAADDVEIELDFNLGDSEVCESIKQVAEVSGHKLTYIKK